jgi:hypothetical protein
MFCAAVTAITITRGENDAPPHRVQACRNKEEEKKNNKPADYYLVVSATLKSPALDISCCAVRFATTVLFRLLLLPINE